MAIEEAGAGEDAGAGTDRYPDIKNRNHTVHYR